MGRAIGHEEDALFATYRLVQQAVRGGGLGVRWVGNHRFRKVRKGTQLGDEAIPALGGGGRGDGREQQIGFGSVKAQQLPAFSGLA